MVLSQLVDKTRQTMCYSSGPSEAFTKFAEKHTKENRHIVKVYTAQELELRDAGGRHEYIVTPTEKQALVLYNLLQHLEVQSSLHPAPSTSLSFKGTFVRLRLRLRLHLRLPLRLCVPLFVPLPRPLFMPLPLPLSLPNVGWGVVDRHRNLWVGIHGTPAG